MFKRLSGRPNIQWMPKKASTAFPNGALVYADGSGAVQPADNTSGNHLGVILRAVTSGDDDYATTAKVPVDVPTPGDLFEVDVPNGDLATSDVGNFCDLDAEDPDGIDPDATAKNVVLIRGYISASKAIVEVNAMAGHVNVATT